MNAYYPVFLNIKSKKCVVIGGGAVALRKTEALLEFGANVTAIGPEMCRELVELANKGRIRLIKRPYGPGDLDGADIAIVASSESDVNARVAREACKGKVLVNVVDNPELSDFIVPSTFRRGAIAIAISTGGKSPALARKIRMKLERDMGDEFAVLAALVGEARTELRSKGAKISSDKWEESIDLDALIGLLRSHGVDSARTYLMNRLQSGNLAEG